MTRIPAYLRKTMKIYSRMLVIAVMLILSQKVGALGLAKIDKTTFQSRDDIVTLIDYDVFSMSLCSAAA